MNFKWIGALLVIAACGGMGFAMAAGCKREEWTMRSLLGALDYMACELQFRLTPLPQLCRQAGDQRYGVIGKVLNRLADELDSQISPDADSCMYAAISRTQHIPKSAVEALRMLGYGLGRFDLQGQLKGLEQVRGFCSRELERMAQGRDQRIRSYQTLGVCAGAALAILFV